MRIEQYPDTETGEEVDRLVVENQKEEFQAEHLFMIGAGVNCRQTARNYKDPLQVPNKEYPIAFSPDSTETIFKGLLKIMNGPALGFHGVKPAEARTTYEELSGQLSQVLPIAEDV